MELKEQDSFLYLGILVCMHTAQAVAGLFEGWHICFYIVDYSGSYSRLRPLLFNSHPYRDKVLPHYYHCLSHLILVSITAL